MSTRDRPPTADDSGFMGSSLAEVSAALAVTVIALSFTSGLFVLLMQVSARTADLLSEPLGAETARELQRSAAAAERTARCREPDGAVDRSECLALDPETAGARPVPPPEDVLATANQNDDSTTDVWEGPLCWWTQQPGALNDVLDERRLVCWHLDSGSLLLASYPPTEDTSQRLTPDPDPDSPDVSVRQVGTDVRSAVWECRNPAGGIHPGGCHMFTSWDTDKGTEMALIRATVCFEPSTRDPGKPDDHPDNQPACWTIPAPAGAGLR